MQSTPNRFVYNSSMALAAETCIKRNNIDRPGGMHRAIGHIKNGGTWNRFKYYQVITEGPNFCAIPTFSTFVRKSQISTLMNAFDCRVLHLPFFDVPDGRNFHKAAFFG